MPSTIGHVLQKIPLNYYTITTMVVFLSITILLYKWLYTNYSIPSPRKLPIIGNLHQLGTLPHRSLRLLSRKYGDLMLLHLGSRPALVVSSAYLAEEILRTHDTEFANRPSLKVGSIVTYNGKDVVLANYGENWRKLKSICVLHMLSNKKVDSFRKIREDEASLMVERVQRASECEANASVNLSNVIVSFTNDVTSRIAFGRKYVGEAGSVSIKSLVDDLAEAFGTGNVGDFIPWLGWIDHLSGVIRKANRVAKGFDVFLEKVVQEHIDRVDDVREDVDKGDKVYDLVDVLLRIQRDDPSLERDTIKALLQNVLAAGVETTSTTLEWAMSELLTHPEAMKQVQDEVRRCSNNTKTRTIINEDELKTMKYLKAVIKEALRLHPPLPLLVFHESSQDVKLGNHDIPKGTMAIINAWAIQRHPGTWYRPDEFRPERFIDTSVELNEKSYKFVPFGAGKRGCPGIALASVKAEIALANLVGKFDWVLPSDTNVDSFMDESIGTAAHRVHPLIAIPTPYSRTSDEYAM